jgi:hypothetical protein
MHREVVPMKGRKKEVGTFILSQGTYLPLLLFVDLNRNSFSKGTAFFFEHIVVELAESWEPFL